jgi:hypothetical protein
MGDNTELGTLAVTEELHAKQQEAARKEAERAARKAPQDAAADAKGEAGGFLDAGASVVEGRGS